MYLQFIDLALRYTKDKNVSPLYRFGPMKIHKSIKLYLQVIDFGMFEIHSDNSPSERDKNMPKSWFSSIWHTFEQYKYAK